MYTALSFAGLVGATVACAVVGLMILSNASCRSTWGPSYAPEFSVLAGCSVVIDGKRVPASAVRVKGETQ